MDWSKLEMCDLQGPHVEIVVHKCLRNRGYWLGSWVLDGVCDFSKAQSLHAGKLKICLFRSEVKLTWIFELLHNFFHIFKRYGLASFDTLLQGLLLRLYMLSHILGGHEVVHLEEKAPRQQAELVALGVQVVHLLV